MQTIFILLAGISCKSSPAGEDISLDYFTGQLDKKVIKLMDQYDIPGVSIAIIREGKLVRTTAYGYADLEHNRNMTLNAVYRVESISKSVTAWGVMRLVEQGLIDLDKPVREYLRDWKFPDSDYPEENITVRRLLSQTSGLPLGTIGEEYPPNSDMPDLAEYLTREVEPAREPGSGFRYSNVGYNLLELLIEEVTGRDFAGYMEEEVLIPLGMHSSVFVWDDSLYAILPTGYDLKGNPVSPYEYPARASGGLFATVEDVARFAMAGMRRPWVTAHKVLDETAIQKIYTPGVDIPGMFGIVSDSYGFGHFIETLPDGRKAVWHGGQGHGWMSHFHSVPESGDGIIILTNSQRSWPLIAGILKDWAAWSGLGAVKMARISYGIIALRILVGFVLIFSSWKLFNLICAFHRGSQRLTFFFRPTSLKRFFQGISGAGMIIILVWCIAQPYLFVSSIFPVTAVWAGIALFMLSATLILSACKAPVKD